MKIYKRLFNCIFLSLFFFTSYGQKNTPTDDKTSLQDTVLLLNGEIIIAKVVNTTPDEITIIKPSKREKGMTIETERIFSVKYSNGSEKVFYSQDSTLEHYFSIEETRLFILGERDAEKAFRSSFATITGIAIGAASGIIIPIPLNILPPVIYSFAVSAPKIRIKRSTVSNPNYLQYDTYILGYERVARKKKTMSVFKGSAIGLIAGFFIYSQFIQNPPLIR